MHPGESFQLCSGALCSLQIFYYGYFAHGKIYHHSVPHFPGLFKVHHLRVLLPHGILLKQHPHSKLDPVWSKVPRVGYLLCKLEWLTDSKKTLPDRNLQRLFSLNILHSCFLTLNMETGEDFTCEIFGVVLQNCIMWSPVPSGWWKRAVLTSMRCF